jgi:putative spermidine/putrescine transport system ATP-binding protein
LASDREQQSPQVATALPIHIQGLTKKYGSMYALDSVDLEVSSGEFLTLLGPSGSGKTTLLMAIAGFNRPDAGSIRFGDDEVILTPPHRRLPAEAARCRYARIITTGGYGVGHGATRRPR